jgi:hypothetical protein
MGFPEDEANMAVTRCGMNLLKELLPCDHASKKRHLMFCTFVQNFLGGDAALSVLVDSIYASQAAENCSHMNLSEYEVTFGLTVHLNNKTISSFNLM